MSLEKKINIIFIFLLFSLPIFGALLLKQNRQPRSVPAPREEVTITIIPGWDLRDVAEYLVEQKFASSTGDVYEIVGRPAVRQVVSLEGYLAPETYRVYRDATLAEVIKKLTDQRAKELKIVSSTIDDQNEILTMASLLEKEARTTPDRKLIADIINRRLKKGWALQLDSTVHYAVDRSGDIFTTAKERNFDSLWNTYKYPGLPPGPICNPSLDAIEAALNPTPNSYWFFLSGLDGKMRYARTLEEHNDNRVKYLR